MTIVYKGESIRNPFTFAYGGPKFSKRVIEFNVEVAHVDEENAFYWIPSPGGGGSSIKTQGTSAEEAVDVVVQGLLHRGWRLTLAQAEQDAEDEMQRLIEARIARLAAR
ncbi:hypothetical protein [Sinimarinibacterium sp. NLF-5-8]|uniref:hypothetical protein n=1 Tax=Sinimarinibacterium sp. NLF-5-8 TaxID=2698684 RepID=UPI00137BCB87|nr:hypothetical protein [Sinimarinibacterium sp. NLF-5-8]QHS08986.1 hypothetical protein GT972_01745 [Sinimarinibacterium sp. NLF-5-8]